MKFSPSPRSWLSRRGPFAPVRSKRRFRRQLAFEELESRTLLSTLMPGDLLVVDTGTDTSGNNLAVCPH